MTCGKSQGFLAKNKVDVTETQDATKQRLGRDDALRLAHEATTVIVARGKKVVQFDMKKSPPTDEALLEVMLGPTGNLRAPTIRRGNTLIVGFNEDEYKAAFG